MKPLLKTSRYDSETNGMKANARAHENREKEGHAEIVMHRKSCLRNGTKYKNVDERTNGRVAVAKPIVGDRQKEEGQRREAVKTEDNRIGSLRRSLIVEYHHLAW
jgi:hypothetical protein